MMRILLILLFLFLCAAPVVAQDAAAPSTSDQQQEESFSRDMSRMFIGLMERMLVEMKRSMLGEDAPLCDCNCAPQGSNI